METQSAIQALAALAQETRLAIFRALVRAHAPAAEQGGLAAGELAEHLDVAPATLSFHLKELASAGLVKSRRDGRSIIYRANLDTMTALAGFLLEDCCQGACGVMTDCAPAAKTGKSRRTT
jgi:ArsR family transcriptional regulator, arsenate/arsenite/antimonite-responsive transcriptional repressor